MGGYTPTSKMTGAVKISAILKANLTIQGSVQVAVNGPVTSSGDTTFTFTLPTDAATSAGVYDSKGALVRTLWSNNNLSAGPQTASWDGNDDLGNPMPQGAYQFRVLSNNVKYTWGAIGDTTANWVGPNTWDNMAEIPTDMAIIGTTAYVANSYAEGRPNAASFSLSQPQMPSSLFTLSQCVLENFVTTDGTLLYFANTGTGYIGVFSYVMAFEPSANTYHSFSAGLVPPAGNDTGCGNNSPGKVIELSRNTRKGNAPTGIAVQTHGNLLAVSHGAFGTFASQDVIKLFDKNSGVQVGTVSVPNPQRIAFASDGDLWVISGNSVVLISSIGNQNNATFTLQGVVKPLALAVDPNTDDILVADGGTAQQVKRFSAGGQLLSTYGDLGGYTDCSPQVTKTRLFLDETAGSGYATGSGFPTPTFLAVLQDGSFWVSDQGNARVLHISYQNQYLEQISFLRFLYHVQADHGNPSRVFANTLEYAIDYTQPLIPGDPDPELGGNSSWTLVKNWSVCLPSNYSQYFTDVQTFGSGRTYGIIRNASPINYPSGKSVGELFELPTSGQYV